MSRNTSGPSVEKPGRAAWREHAAEVAFIGALIFLYAGTAPPDVNEAHYLTKAKHFWNPAWCGSDVFLDSAEAHTVFYGLWGWPTLWLSLPVATWCGRLVTWSLFAWGWQRLSWSILPRRYLSVLTMAWFLVLNSHFHMAGEWAVGGWEAKSVAYALVLWGLCALVRGQWNAVWIWLGAASAFHVLVGGWSVVAAAIAWWLSGSRRTALRSQWSGIVLGGCLSLTGLVPALWLASGVDAATANTANSIYVFDRLPHHLVFHSIAPTRLVMFGTLIVVWMVLSWSVRRCEPWLSLHHFAIGALTIAIFGIVLDLSLLWYPALAANGLRFYWFRLADVAVPLVVSMALPLAISRGAISRGAISRGAISRGAISRGAISRGGPERASAARWLWCATVLVPMLLLGNVFVGHQRDFRPGAIVQSSPPGSWSPEQLAARNRSWYDVCIWVAENTDPQDRFLTPRNQQTFKWYAQRAEVACWKDIPQDPASIVAWQQLIQEIYPPVVMAGGLGAWSDDQLQAIADRHQVDYILVDRAYTKRRLGFQRVYPESPAAEGWFELYRIRLQASGFRLQAPEKILKAETGKVALSSKL